TVSRLGRLAGNMLLQIMSCMRAARGCYTPSPRRGSRSGAAASGRVTYEERKEQPMKRRRLGPNGPEVSEIGLGCMGMSAFYGATDETEARATIERALDLGCNF